MNETKKVSKKQKAKKSNIRRNVLMIILCIALLSSATYAWFTLSNTAKISNLSLKVGGAGGLLIAYEENGTYGSELKMGTPSDKKVFPASIGKIDTGDTKLYNPGESYGNVITKEQMQVVASDQKLTYNFGSSAWNSPDKAYCVEQDFWLKVNSEGNYDISLNATNFNALSSGENDKTSVDALNGSYIVEQKGDKYIKPTGNMFSAADILKIAFYTVDDSDISTLKAVYEPNADVVATVNANERVASPAEFHPYTENVVKQGHNGKFGNSSTYDQDKSTTLFTIEGGPTPTHIKMQIYFDGHDAECANGVALEQIYGQIEFVSAVSP